MKKVDIPNIIPYSELLFSQNRKLIPIAPFRSENEPVRDKFVNATISDPPELGHVERKNGRLSITNKASEDKFDP
nr:hypothetical protein [Candidatus Njordarchaeota archaeon]